MPSFTSSSSRRSHAADLAWSVATFLIVGGVTAAWWRLAPHAPPMFVTPTPTSADAYFAVNHPAFPHHLDHVALYHGAYGTPRYLRAADVLFLGNSRLMFGFAPDVLDDLSRRLGLSYYLLGFGHSEPAPFPMAIVRRFDLRPRFVVVNADPFFVGDTSPYARTVAAMSAFDARKVLFEGAAYHLAHTYLDAWLPQWPNLADGRRTFTLYRSRRTGAWLGPAAYPSAVPFRESDDAPPVPPQCLEVARRFKEEMDARGTRIVLTFVPSPAGCRSYAEQFARLLGVPLVAPRLDGLETFDHSHLTPASARRFTAAFAAEFDRLLESHPAHPAVTMAGHGR